MVPGQLRSWIDRINGASDAQKLGLLLLLTLAITAIPFFKYDVVSKDAVRYLYCAQGIAAGEWRQALQHEKMLFVPTLIAGVHRLGPDLILAGQLVSIAAMTLLVIPFFRIGKIIFGPEKAFLSSLFLSVSPYFRLNAIDVMRDPVFLLCFIWFIYFWLQTLICKGQKYYLLALIAAILAALSRVEGMVLFVVWVGYVAIRGVMAASSTVRRMTLVAVLLLLVVLGVFVHHYDAAKYNTNRLDELIVLAKNPVQAYQNLSIHRIREQLLQVEKQMPELGGKGSILEIARNDFVEIYLISLTKIWISCAFFVLFILGVWGIGAELPIREKPYQKYLLWFMLLFLVIPYSVLIKYNFLSDRYLLTASLLLYLWIGSGVISIFHYLEKKSDRLFPKWSWVVMAILLVIPVIRIITERTGRESNIKECGLWLKSNNAPQQLILTNDKRLLLYSGATFAECIQKGFTVDENFPVLRQRAKELKVRWIAYRFDSDETIENGYVKSFGGKKLVAVYQIDAP